MPGLSLGAGGAQVADVAGAGGGSAQALDLVVLGGQAGQGEGALVFQGGDGLVLLAQRVFSAASSAFSLVIWASRGSGWPPDATAAAMSCSNCSFRCG